jgi:1-acyl-sn-glycerol-3-phosphate acyltransferase
MKELFYKIVYKLVALTIRIIFSFNGGLEVLGKENIPAGEGVIIAPNHISYLDPPIIGAVLPRNGNFMAKKSLFEVPVLGWMIKGAAFPVDRDNPRPSTIKEAVRRLKKDQIVIMFPEGHRNDTGELMDAKRGVGMVATLSRATIIPAYIRGSDRALPPNAKWLKRAKISVVFGKPIYYNFTNHNKKQRSNELQEDIGSKIMSSIAALKEEYGNNSC